MPPGLATAPAFPLLRRKQARTKPEGNLRAKGACGGTITHFLQEE